MNATTILNVNDQAAARYLVSRHLRTAGFEVVEAVDGAEALRLATERPPALVVLDVQLPDLDGFEICRRLRADPHTAAVAVLLTSATLISHESRIVGLEGGADGYLVQPFVADELIATVRSLIRGKESEREQRERAEALAEADRRKDEFLAMLAHELRNPLAAISSASAMLEPPLSPSHALKAGAVIRRQVSHLARLVDDLLDVSRMVRGTIVLRRETLQLDAVMRAAGAQARLARLDGRGQTLVLEIEGDGWPIEADPVRLDQMIANLIDNASKFSPAGGTITVRLTQAEGHATLCVRDRGVGVAPDKLPHLFEPFYQADPGIDRARGGLGIGLALVKSLAELHGGSVIAHSDGLGMGCEVAIRLPLCHARRSTSNGDGHPRAAAAVPHRTRVLVVEDNDDTRLITTDLLTQWGHQVYPAADGDAGVDLAARERPEVGIIDLGLPGIDGLEVARRLRRDPTTARMTLVALSGYGTDEVRRKALAAGFDHVVVKPASAEVLRAVAAGRPPPS